MNPNISMYILIDLYRNGSVGIIEQFISVRRPIDRDPVDSKYSIEQYHLKRIRDRLSFQEIRCIKFFNRINQKM